jgi:hypothetical protein
MLAEKSKIEEAGQSAIAAAHAKLPPCTGLFKISTAL